MPNWFCISSYLLQWPHFWVHSLHTLILHYCLFFFVGWKNKNRGCLNQIVFVKTYPICIIVCHTILVQLRLLIRYNITSGWEIVIMTLICLNPFLFPLRNCLYWILFRIQIGRLYFWKFGIHAFGSHIISKFFIYALILGCFYLPAENVNVQCGLNRLFWLFFHQSTISWAQERVQPVVVSFHNDQWRLISLSYLYFNLWRFLSIQSNKSLKFIDFLFG